MSDNVFLSTLFAFIASIGFAIIFNIKGKNLLFASLGGALGWFFYMLLKPVFEDDVIRYFISAVIISLYAEFMAKMRKTPAIVFLVISLIPLVPGYSMYKTMENLLLSQIDSFSQTGLYTFKAVMAISTGVLVSSKGIVHLTKT